MRLSFSDMITSLRRDVFDSKGSQGPQRASLPQAPRPPMPLKRAKVADGSLHIQIALDLGCANTAGLHDA
jgi:hypothetical protein